MINAELVAKYFLSKDNERKLFNMNVVTYNNRNFYEGNARLNKYLFLSQVVYLAKYNKRLFNDDFRAYDNGPVILDIMKTFPVLKNEENFSSISDKDKIFLDKIYESLENATYEELIDITHEDPEWLCLKELTYNAPVMDLEKHIDEYKKRYKGLIEALNI
ncbi:MAG TPA: hypothetical protein DD613_01300 [Firmicutes bacterium]|jgi:uncharacterized phage-associated protein|nr:hypothetical protein [Bacillota bacterium]